MDQVFCTEKEIKRMFSKEEVDEGSPLSNRRKTATKKDSSLDLKDIMKQLQEKERELNSERNLNRSLREQLESSRKRVQQLELNEAYSKLELKSLKEANFTLDETNKRLTKHLDEVFEKQKKLISENQTVYNQYLELSLKVDQPFLSRARTNRSQTSRKPRNDSINSNNSKVSHSVLERSSSQQVLASESSIYMSKKLQRPTIQAPIIQEFPPFQPVLVKVPQRAISSKGFSPRRIGRRPI